MPCGGANVDNPHTPLSNVLACPNTWAGDFFGSDNSAKAAARPGVDGEFKLSHWAGPACGSCLRFKIGSCLPACLGKSMEGLVECSGNIALAQVTRMLRIWDLVECTEEKHEYAR